MAHELKAKHIQTETLENKADDRIQARNILTYVQNFLSNLGDNDLVPKNYVDFLFESVGIEKYKGSYETLPDAEFDITDPEIDDLIVIRGNKSIYWYDGSSWEPVGGSTETPATIKTKYESNANTNAFTDSEKSKLSGIATGATKNANTDELSEGTNNKYFTEARAVASKLVGYVKAATVSAITSATSILEAIGILEKALDNKVNTEDGKGLSSNDYTDEDKDKLENIEEEAQKNVQSDWNQSNSNSDDYIKNKPSLFSGSWNDLSDKPALFPPAAHTHEISEVSGLLAALSGKVDKETGKGLLSDADQLKIDAIDIDGDGTKFLTDDGTYKSELNPRTYIEESASGSVSIDLANKDVIHIEMSGNITSFNVTNPVVGKTYKIYMIQDSVGNRTLTGLDPKFKTENDIPILLSTDQNAVDLLQLDVFSSTDIKIFPVYNI